MKDEINAQIGTKFQFLIYDANIIYKTGGCGDTYLSLYVFVLCVPDTIGESKVPV